MVSNNKKKASVACPDLGQATEAFFLAGISRDDSWVIQGWFRAKHEPHKRTRQGLSFPEWYPKYGVFKFTFGIICRVVAEPERKLKHSSFQYFNKKILASLIMSFFHLLFYIQRYVQNNSKCTLLIKYINVNLLFF